MRDKTFNTRLLNLIGPHEKKINIITEVVIIGVIVFLVSTFFFQLVIVRGDSMEPSLNNGQVLIARKFNLDIENNDIAVIKKNNKIIIKRVIGIPKDKIEIQDGYIYVNHLKFDDRYIENIGNIIEPIILNENQYFVLGDNRNHSIDSRNDEIGIIEKENIIGLIW